MPEPESSVQGVSARHRAQPIRRSHPTDWTISTVEFASLLDIGWRHVA